MNYTPLIVAYYDGDSEVQLLSNFALTPFLLDEMKYQSVEGFWQGLKTEIPSIRSDIAMLSRGLDAKRIGQELSTSNIFSYAGNLYARGSEQHHALLERAIRAKTQQNIEVQKCFIDSYPRPLLHMIKNRFGQLRTGDSPTLPAKVFEDILQRIRIELIENTFDFETLPVLPSGFNEF